LAKKSIELRYELMPYIYTLAFENNQTGLPLMRPLFFEEQSNTDLLHISDTYLWGDAFVVSTVTEAGLKEKEVYLPNGSIWFDFVSDKKYEGGKSYTIALKEDHIPVFVRGGSFIPTKKGMKNTIDYSLEDMNVDYYYEPSVVSANGKLYNDNGETPNAFEKGEYELLKFESKSSKSKIVLNVSTEMGANYQSINKKISWTIHNINKEPKQIKLDKKSIDFEWNKETKTIQFSGELEEGKNQSITIKLAK